MSAKLNGSEVGLFLPPPTGLPSNNMADAEFFLSIKGIDSRIGACQYYRAIGAVKSCDAQGVPSGAITFDDWKRKVKMEPYAVNGAKDIVATYINRVDLNLTRNHHSLSYEPNKVAAYVCNHLGPKDDTQAAADSAIENAVNGKDLVACVAMDHGVTSGVNGNKAFTRFLIFGPSGQLLLSVNLDGRREKFVPGVCVACHGGDRYVGRFPENGTGFADIGAHFLPYDSGNFTFSTKAGYTQADLEPVIHELNMNVLQAGPNTAITELIQGWYSSSTTTIDLNYVPPSWQVRPAADLAFYKDVYARSCRTCHVAFTESLNFDNYANMISLSQPVGETGYLRTEISACDGGSSSFVRNFSMPNSPRTLDLFWGSSGTAVDEPLILGTFLTTLFTNTVTCSIQTSPNP
jgi:mono/diheme cytochrome c family protein